MNLNKPESNLSNFKNREINKTKPFSWKDYLEQPENMPVNLAIKLDFLAEIINSDDPASEEFKKDFASYRDPIQSLVNYFRSELSQEERVSLNKAIEECGKKHHKISSI